jgi:hypothetical protein
LRNFSAAAKWFDADAVSAACLIFIMVPPPDHFRLYFWTLRGRLRFDYHVNEVNKLKMIKNRLPGHRWSNRALPGITPI